MYSLEDQIERYTDESFSAESAAQHIFASYSETEIAKKLQDMGNMQASIETVLKQKVRSNYGMFLQANEQINQVGVEMADLKHLIENTQKLINDVRSNRLGESRAMRTNSLLPSLQHQLQEEAKLMNGRGSVSLQKGALADAKMPSWLKTASEDLARYIVEQQFVKAVAVVLKTRAYADSIAQSSSSGARFGASDVTPLPPAVLEVLRSVNERSAHLAVAIKKSLLNLPNSQLWGSAEQNKRLKLLISLGEFHMAAEGFSLSKVVGVKKALRATEFTGDTLLYTAELSRAFFSVLTDSSASFLSLFGDGAQQPAIMSLLLQWLHTQLAAYVEVLARQIQLGINECAAVIIIQLRQLGSGSFNNNNNNNNNSSDNLAEIAANNAAAEEASRRKSMFNISAAMANERSLNSNSSYNNTSTQSLESTDSEEGHFGAQSVMPFNSRNNSPKEAGSSSSSSFLTRRPTKSLGVTKSAVTLSQNTSRKNNSIGRGSLSFAASCLESAFSEARTMDRLQLQSTPCLGWVLLPEIQQFVSSYAEEFIREIAGQVRQETWAPVVPTYFSVLMPGSDRYNNSNKKSAVATADKQPSVSLSFDWITSVLNHFTGMNTIVCNKEVWVLLKGQEDMNGTNVSAYSRADVCEVEPTAVACIMRILLRYVVEVEATDTASMSAAQLDCFVQSIDALVNKLIPSVQRVITECFFADAASLLNNSPASIFKMLVPRLTRLAKEKLSGGSPHSSQTDD